MNELFQRPANYWLRHADRHKQSGDLIRAAVLQRHAVCADADSVSARTQYALTLRQLHCYEASNREAFRALADQPGQLDLFGLIGCNFFSMGLTREGLDALDVYLDLPYFLDSPFLEEACTYWDEHQHQPAPRKRRTRLEGLLSIASARISRGDLDGAQKALKRASQKPFTGFSMRRELVNASYWLHRRKPDICFRHLSSALNKAGWRCEAYAAAAGILQQAGQRSDALHMLLIAAKLARNPGERRLVCHTAATLKAIFIAQAMLRHTLTHHPQRVPVLYDLCVCALRMGDLSQALRHIHLCREIDPDDIPSEALFARVIAWEQQAISRKALRTAARTVSFYGSCSEAELAVYARPVWEAMGDHPQTLADALLADERLRRRLLFLLALPLKWPALLLNAVCPCLPAAECEALLREVLMQHPSDHPAKRSAMALLSRLNVEEPVTAWTHGRFLTTPPQRLFAPIPTFRQRRLTIFIHNLANACGSDCIPWALEVVSRMPPKQQCRLIGDPWKVWQLAFAMRWRALCGLPPMNVPFETLSPLRLQALRKALETLHRAD